MKVRWRKYNSYSSKNWLVEIIETEYWYSVYILWELCSKLIKKETIEQFMFLVDEYEREVAFEKMVNHRNSVLELITVAIEKYNWNDDWLSIIFEDDFLVSDEQIKEKEEEKETVKKEMEKFISEEAIIDEERKNILSKMTIKRYNIFLDKDSEHFKKFVIANWWIVEEVLRDEKEERRYQKILYIYKFLYVYNNEIKLYLSHLVEEMYKNRELYDSKNALERDLFDNFFKVKDIYKVLANYHLYWWELWTSRNYSFSYTKLLKSFWLTKEWNFLVNENWRKEYIGDYHTLEKEILIKWWYCNWSFDREPRHLNQIFMNACNFVHWWE